MRFNKRWSIGIAVLAAAVGLAGCTTPSEPVSTHLTLAGATEIDYNPASPTRGQYYATPAVQAVYDTLLIWDQTDDSFDPWLVEEYTLDETKTHMVMTLRDDVDFIDGEPLSAEGVVKLLELQGGLAADFTAEFVVVDELTFEINTVQPLDHGAFQLFDDLVIASPVALDDQETLAGTPVGTGPYILDAENSTAGVELNYTRNPDYWNPDVYPYETLTIKQYNDDIAALNALKSGQIDAAKLTIQSAIEAENSGFQMVVGNAIYRFLQLGDHNGDVLPAMGDVRVRQAINMAFDQDAINEAIDFGYGGTNDQVFTTGQLAFIEGREDEYPFDPERAMELLAEAGYPDGFELKIPTLVGFTDELEPIVQQALADIGITVIYEPLADFAQFFAEYANYPVIMWPNYYVNTINFTLRPQAFFVGWGIDPHVAELVEKVSFGGPDAYEAGQELGVILLEEAWYAPFSKIPDAWATTQDVDVTLEPLTASIRLQLFKPSTD